VLHVYLMLAVSLGAEDRDRILVCNVDDLLGEVIGLLFPRARVLVSKDFSLIEPAMDGAPLGH
jgi:hypothetical protein